ncbi:MAG: N-methylhydantoinase [Solirubrobacteraceae bacterium]
MPLSARGHDFTIAVDIGGTFTDLIAYDARTGEFRHAKRPTTPRDLADGILDCIDRSGADLGETGEIVHGSTIAINTVLEGKGAPTALIVTRGTRDVYSIGRGNRPDAYNLFFRRPRPLVPRELTFEVPERLLASGAIETPLDEEAVAEIAARLRELGISAVAVCFLHAYAYPDHERRAGEILRRELPDAYVSLSHEILREYREYERTSTTVVNSYIGPVVSRYVGGLGARLGERDFSGPLWIMQSNGGVMSAREAARKPVATMESGPVGGIIAAAEVGRRLGYDDVISFDMGGTTAKASLIRDATPSIADGYHVGGYNEGHPVMSPVVDIVEVGTGGGSIAWLDEVGALMVGPRSAGAEPGPVCYGRGGTEPTITDANVVLGRIRPQAFLGGDMALDRDGAWAGIESGIAHPLGLTVVEAAHGILEIAAAKMSLAVREVSVVKGYDPRDFVLVASGGGGPIHSLAIARELKIPTVVVPRFPAHFSALGMLLTDQRHDLVQTIFTRLDAADPAQLLRIRREMVERIEGLVDRDRSEGEIRFETQLDLRYAGQDFTLPVPLGDDELAAGDLESVRRRFDDLHQRRYGHQAPDERVEAVNLRVAGRAGRAKPPLGQSVDGTVEAATASAEVHVGSSGDAVEARVLQRDTLAPGSVLEGPALIEEYGSTTVLFAGDRCAVAPTLELLIEVGGA